MASSLWRQWFMKFAHFAHVWNKAGMSPAQRYHQLWRELQVADELGFDYGFCVEHHFRPDESWMSAPNLQLVANRSALPHARLVELDLSYGIKATTT